MGHAAILTLEGSKLCHIGSFGGLWMRCVNGVKFCSKLCSGRDKPRDNTARRTFCQVLPGSLFVLSRVGFLCIWLHSSFVQVSPFSEQEVGTPMLQYRNGICQLMRSNCFCQMYHLEFRSFLKIDLLGHVPNQNPSDFFWRTETTMLLETIPALTVVLYPYPDLNNLVFWFLKENLD